MTRLIPSQRSATRSDQRRGASNLKPDQASSLKPLRHLSAALIGAALMMAMPAPGQAQSCTWTLDEASAQLDAESLQLQQLDEAIAQSELLEVRARATLMPSANVTAQYILSDEEISFDMGNPYEPLAPYLQEIEATSPGVMTRDGYIPSEYLTQSSGDPAIVQYRHNYRLIGTVSQTIFNGQALPALYLARDTITQVSARRDATAYQLEQALYSVYFQAVLAQRMREAAEANVALLQIAYDRASAAFEEGVGLEFEVNRARVAFNSAQRDVDNAQLGYLQALEALRVLVNADQACDVVAPPVLSADDVQRGRLEERPDFVATQRELDSAEQSLEVSRGALLPTVQAQFQAIGTRATEFGGDGFNWSLTINAVWNLFGGGRTRADIASSSYDVAIAELAYDDQLAQAESAITQLERELQTLELQLLSAHENVALAEENLAITEAARDEGIGSTLDVEAARAQLYLTQLAVVDTETRIQSSRYRLQLLSWEGR